MFELAEIKEQIKKKNVCWGWKVSGPTDYKLILKTNGKNEAYKQIKAKYTEPKKMDPDVYFIIGKITFHSGKKFGQAGPIAFNLDVVAFSDGKLFNVIKSSNTKYTHLKKLKGVIWFDKIYLEKNGWSNNYLDNIIKKLIKGNINIMQRMIYHVKFK
jgi:hypothetical protein